MILDEYADEKAGGQSAGALRQYNGRMGKVDICQVAVALGYANWKLEPWPLWTMVDAEIFLPEVWFGTEYAGCARKWAFRKNEPALQPIKYEYGRKSGLTLPLIKNGWQCGSRAMATTPMPSATH